MGDWRAGGRESSLSEDKLNSAKWTCGLEKESGTGGNMLPVPLAFTPSGGEGRVC